MGEKSYGKRWTRRFEILDGLIEEDRWYIDTKKSLALSIGDRFAIGFSLWGFLFNIIYYYAKGMWAKASFLATVGFLSAAVLEFAGAFSAVPAVSVIHALMFAVFCSGFAVLDYYHKEKRGERMWPIFPSVFGEVWFAVVAPIASYALYFWLLDLSSLDL